MLPERLNEIKRWRECGGDLRQSLPYLDECVFSLDGAYEQIADMRQMNAALRHECDILKAVEQEACTGSEKRAALLNALDAIVNPSTRHREADPQSEMNTILTLANDALTAYYGGAHDA